MLFQLRFSGKQLEKMASKAEKDHNAEKNKIKKVHILYFHQVYGGNAI